MPTTIVSIVGEGHSGSTLLDLILGSHSRMVSVGEVHSLDRYRRGYGDCTCGAAIASCPFWRPTLARYDAHVASMPGGDPETSMQGVAISGTVRRLRYRLQILTTMHLPVHRLRPLLAAVSPDMVARARRALLLFDAIAEQAAASVVVDSSKSVNRFRLLHALEPEANRAIFLTRDGRAYVAGNIRRHQLGPRQSSRDWRATNLYTRRMLRRAPAESHIHVRYEELCRDPAGTIARVCDFIGLEFEPAMLDFRNRVTHNIGGNRMRLESARDITEDTSWRASLTGEQLHQFDHAAGISTGRCSATSTRPDLKGRPRRGDGRARPFAVGAAGMRC